VVKPPTHLLVGNGDLDHIILANTSGLFSAHTQLLADVRAGDLLGEIRDVTGQTLEQLRSPVDGVIITLRGLVRVHTGDGVFALAQREAPL
ncbi:MAG: hypothetical protein ABI874_13860, partial [Chloroflexota bacterium]